MFGITRFCHGKADFAAPEAIGNVRNGKGLRDRQPANRHNHADIVQVPLMLIVDSDMACPVDWFARLARLGWVTNQWKREPFLRFNEEFLHTPLVDEIL